MFWTLANSLSFHPTTHHFGTRINTNYPDRLWHFCTTTANCLSSPSYKTSFWKTLRQQLPIPLWNNTIAEHSRSSKSATTPRFSNRKVAVRLLFSRHSELTMEDIAPGAAWKSIFPCPQFITTTFPLIAKNTIILGVCGADLEASDPEDTRTESTASLPFPLPASKLPIARTTTPKHRNAGLTFQSPFGPV